MAITYRLCKKKPLIAYKLLDIADLRLPDKKFCNYSCGTPHTVKTCHR